MVDERPPLYRILDIPSEYGTEGAEIGYIRALLAAYTRKVISGSITTNGRNGLFNIYLDLKEVEHLLEEKK